MSKLVAPLLCIAFVVLLAVSAICTINTANEVRQLRNEFKVSRKATKSFLDTLNKISILGIIFMGVLTLVASILYTLVRLFY